MGSGMGFQVMLKGPRRDFVDQTQSSGRNLVVPEYFKSLTSNEYDRVGKMLNGLMTSLRTRLPKT
jgi:hypothetical protein